MPAPDATARQLIDRALTESGWAVLDIADTKLGASRGVAIREFPLTSGHGFADYVLFVDGRAAGVIEAKKAGTTLTGVELQAAKSSTSSRIASTPFPACASPPSSALIPGSEATPTSIRSFEILLLSRPPSARSTESWQ